MVVAGYDSLHYPVLQSPEVHHQQVGRVLYVGGAVTRVEHVEQSSSTNNPLLSRFPQINLYLTLYLK